MRKVFLYHSAHVHFLINDDGKSAKVVDLLSARKGQGDATQVMCRAMDYADENGIHLWLEVQRYGKPQGALNNEELVRFYEKFGFRSIKRRSLPTVMEREPILKGDE